MNNTENDSFDKDKDTKKENSSLEQELIEALAQKNEDIKSGNTPTDKGEADEDKKSGGFDKWSVSWP
ncbi:MAG: hypothetical protein EOP55_20130 [Sphingobacteriales bacterium]|nr:MAG: hypothetical protein EOP55_20130 [Sphingobacteriales bacterium]